MSLSQELSKSVLSDPLPRVYSCYCNKIFTTYPGIYLHLKTKHIDLFPKYRKRKITKSFVKIQGQPGTQFYKLIELAEDQQKNVTKCNLQNKQDTILRDQQNTFQAIYNQTQKYKNAYLIQNYKPNDQSLNKTDYRVSSGCYQPFFPSFFPYYPQNSYLFSSTNSYFSLPFQTNYQNCDITIKRLLETFLLQKSQNEVSEYKKILYNLLIYLDNHYIDANDGRLTNSFLFISYCDHFDLLYVGPLLKQRIRQLRVINQSGTQSARKQLEITQQFCSWVVQQNYISKQFLQFVRDHQSSNQNVLIGLKLIQ